MTRLMRFFKTMTVGARVLTFIMMLLFTTLAIQAGFWMMNQASTVAFFLGVLTTLASIILFVGLSTFLLPIEAPAATNTDSTKGESDNAQKTE